MNQTYRPAVRFLAASITLLLCCAFLPPSVAALPRATAEQITLVNPGFESPYGAVPGGYVAQGWTSHYRENTLPPLAESGGGSDPTRRPEFKPIEAAQFPNRVAEGERAQVAFAFYGIMDAAFSQQVDVEQDRDVQFSIQAHGWSTNSDDPGQHSGEVYVSLGIGAEGQSWPWEHGIEWTRYEWTPGSYQTYYSRVVTAESERVTLFVLVTNKWSVKHNDVYLDDARCWYVAESGELPPQNCPECPPCEPGTCNEEQIATTVVERLEEWFAGLRWVLAPVELE